MARQMEIEIKYFDYTNKVVCPFCSKEITIPEIRDLIYGSTEDQDPTTDIVIITEGGING